MGNWYIAGSQNGDIFDFRENVHLNIELYQGAISGSFFAFVSKRMPSIIISKLKGIL